MRIKRLKDWNLKNKVILHVGVIGILTALFLSYFCSRTQRNIILSTSERKAELVGTMVQGSIFIAMKEGRSAEVKTILKNISLSKDIQNIRILSPEGAILNSSTPDEMGQTVTESSKRFLEAFLTNTQAQLKMPRKPTDLLQEYRVIHNEPQCQSCHDPQKKINGVLEVSLDYSPVFSILKTNQFRGIFISLVSLAVLSLIILRLFEKLINRPLVRLKKSMAGIQEGDKTHFVPVIKDDEIGGLAKSFNLMVARLEEANNKISELHNRQMEKAEHLASLGEIAAGLAHEIKNPIAGMKGALEIIYQKTAEADTNKEVFKEILVQIDRVDRIIQDLLRYAKPKELNIQPVPVEPIIDNAIKMAEPQKKHKDIRLQFVDKGNNIRAALDADKIQQVLLNLILNSIAAIEEKGTISIRLLTENEESLKITVADDGSGIRKEQLSQIFQPFFTTKSRGTGLGLSICKKTIDAHEGTIEVESEEGKGTTFSIILPSQQSDH